jgi:hypothetical protein
MMTDNVEMVTITKKEYNQLLNDADFLSCLESCGVDNWCGYDEACNMYEPNEDDEEE